VLLAHGGVAIVVMAVVRVMQMNMVTIERFMTMPVLMLLAHEKRNSDGHEQPGGEAFGR
jgi:hypothetical protein